MTITCIHVHLCVCIYTFFFLQNWNDAVQCSVCFTVIYGFWGFLSFTSFPVFLLSEFSRVNLYFLDIRIFFFFTKHNRKVRSSESRRKPIMTRYLPCFKVSKVWNVAGYAWTHCKWHPQTSSVTATSSLFQLFLHFFIRAKGANYCCGTFYIFSAMLLLFVDCSFCSCLLGLPAQGYPGQWSVLTAPPHPHLAKSCRHLPAPFPVPPAEFAFNSH